MLFKRYYALIRKIYESTPDRRKKIQELEKLQERIYKINPNDPMFADRPLENHPVVSMYKLREELSND
ncbi:MAG: hypothetical protein Q7S27_01570 [Nanoarchaeota archaeon]|nr:hypothetical protein [Nanoarchaeota archaeon]